MLRTAAFALGLLAAVPALADARLTVLVDALKIGEVAQIMRDEGHDYAAELESSMLDGQGGDFWAAQIDQLYDAGRISEAIRTALDQGLEEDELDAAVAFFASERGDRIVTLENAARIAMGDPAIEAAITEEYEALRAAPDALIDRIDAFIAANDLTERNVTASMDASYRFLVGLVEGGMVDMSEDEIVDDVWSDEESIREETETWIHGFALLAYQPLPTEDMEAYLAFSRTAAGQALNTALFDGFGAVYSDLSYALGRLVALSASTSEL
ncbi:DUF2059 domain-containing protein [Sulfitobacter sp. D35]|uniref:DUF2059 domain-containing protein n=1 Tax=Sulfitobacter sp. D35 TaxID=3083252 RepID=UPI00296EE569|nr:DUF2059 domain-containing protein [Sulfitobacter sp. D35]MDW4496553.1 DUF2059 domain-containing protein [Sulfitobacter sp. D35]